MNTVTDSVNELDRQIFIPWPRGHWHKKIGSHTRNHSWKHSLVWGDDTEFSYNSCTQIIMKCKWLGYWEKRKAEVESTEGTHMKEQRITFHFSFWCRHQEKRDCHTQKDTRAYIRRWSRSGTSKKTNVSFVWLPFMMNNTTNAFLGTNHKKIQNVSASVSPQMYVY